MQQADTTGSGTDFSWVAQWLEQLKGGYGRFASHFEAAFDEVGVEDETDLLDIDDGVFARLEDALRRAFDAKPVYLSKLRRMLCEAGAHGLSRPGGSTEVAQASCVQLPIATASLVVATPDDDGAAELGEAEPRPVVPAQRSADLDDPTTPLDGLPRSAAQSPRDLPTPQEIIEPPPPRELDGAPSVAETASALKQGIASR